MSRATTAGRFLARVDTSAGPGACHPWTGAVKTSGYGSFHPDGNGAVSAHRWVYEHFVGPIPDGMTIDHTCHNRDRSCTGGVTCPHRRCCNARHLAVATIGANAQASPNSAVHRETCPRQHDPSEFTVGVRGSRKCRACERERRRERYAAARGGNVRQWIRTTTETVGADR